VADCQDFTGTGRRVRCARRPEPVQAFTVSSSSSRFISFLISLSAL
jgi:hypothetical protein